MVLRKPYAFLIRHFKAIHIILVILMGFLVYKMYNMSSFLGPYLEAGEYGVVSGVAGKYVGFFGLLIPIIIIFLLGSIAYLLKRKEKPIKYYLITMLIYFIELITMIVGFTIFTSIEQGTVNSTLASIFNDLVKALAVLPLPFMLISLVRGVGFNVKQFNFKKDLIELHIEEGDSEEFELEMEFDNENLKARINRRIRFIRYVYLENKKVFFGVFIFVILVIAILVIKYLTSIEHIYTTKEHYKSSGIDFVVNNSYITNRDCSGREIKAGKYYVIINMTGNNKTKNDQKLLMDYMYLKVDGHKQYNPTDSYIDEFSDFGNRMTSDTYIPAKTTMTFNLVFEIDSKYKDIKKVRFDHIKSFKQNLDGSYKYAKVNLWPKRFKEEQTINTVKLEKKLDFKGSLVEGTSLVINSAEVGTNFNYKYTKTIGGKEKEFTKNIFPTEISRYRKAIIKLDAKLTKNDNLNSKIYDSFYEKFALIEYEDNGIMRYGKSYIIDLTKDDGYTYLEVNYEALNSNKVNLVFTIRDKVYKYTIIEKDVNKK
ncbi:MAG: hypothetical protein IKQ35_02410 [Bacilli bacterium]|nr:hypothetical protein [Bacilli bacterium]